MKKLITILVLSSAMLSACEGDPEFVPKTSVEAKIHELMIGYDGKIDIHSGRTAGCLADRRHRYNLYEWKNREWRYGRSGSHE